MLVELALNMTTSLVGLADPTYSKSWYLFPNRPSISFIMVSQMEMTGVPSESPLVNITLLRFSGFRDLCAVRASWSMHVRRVKAVWSLTEADSPLLKKCRKG
eukprot:Lithocolla_globosa_v1_NODE_72_length_6942_cov_12.745027.p5 type:complete len:102 gc:universal NODE_72_length_6942_cov_12.745027:2265-1960(-)